MKKKMIYISIVSVAVCCTAVLIYCLETFTDLKGFLIKKYSKI